jgi:hypothetical protein
MNLFSIIDPSLTLRMTKKGKVQDDKKKEKFKMTKRFFEF